MSIDASVDLRIVHARSGAVISPTKTLEILANHYGWSLISKDGYVCYLPLGDDGMFDWTGSKTPIPLLMKILKQKEQRGELIGVGMTWQDTEIGGEVLLWQEKEMLQKNIHTSMSFCLTSNRKLLIDNGDQKITDVNWYLTKLLPIFNQGDTFVEYFTYEEHI